MIKFIMRLTWTVSLTTLFHLNLVRPRGHCDGPTQSLRDIYTETWSSRLAVERKAVAAMFVKKYCWEIQRSENRMV
jgi:hypothetical protein